MRRQRPRKAARNRSRHRGATLSSSDTAVATVAADGLITGVSAGMATITAAYSGRSATFAVQVA
ncbi:Ig-like domain-containing protein [Paenirhodobacter sp.]|uniref:Ig-like domain-containing protein n=1 Tax=Paenirhodobacter sp. TaxID=1965326 RepID=UPI003B508E43